MLRAGRFTAGAILIAFGVGLLMNQLTGEDYLTSLFHYWPVILIAIGIEFFIISLIRRNRENPVRFDFGAVIGAVVISLVVGIFVQGQTIFSTEGFHWLKGKRYEKAPMVYALDRSTQNIKIENMLGDVTLLQGDGDQIEIEAVVYVYHGSASTARKIADEVTVHIDSGRTMLIRTEAEPYRMFIFNNRPRMDLFITIPEQTMEHYEIRMRNGNFAATGMKATDEFHVYTTKGDVTVSEIEADLHIETTNGDIDSSVIAGMIYMKTTNGDIEARALDGGVELRTTNGDVSIDDVDGRIQSSTTNGNVDIKGAKKAVNVSTTNGDIHVYSPEVGGDWRIRTNNGKVKIAVPADGDYRVAGKTSNGKLSTDLGLTISKRKIEGSVGAGTYLLDLTTNRNIEIQSIDD